MASLKIALPDEMKDWVLAETAAGKYKSASEYMRSLIRRDQERAARPKASDLQIPQ